MSSTKKFLKRAAEYHGLKGEREKDVYCIGLLDGRASTRGERLFQEKKKGE